MREREQAGQIYELTRNPRPSAVGLLAASWLFFGTTGIATEIDTPNVGMLIVGALSAARAGQIALFWPTRLVVDDAGITFYARGRTRLVPWADIRTVRVSRRRKYGGGIRWRLAEPPHITTAATFARLHHLLLDIEHHAPHAQIID